MAIAADAHFVQGAGDGLSRVERLGFARHYRLDGHGAAIVPEDDPGEHVAFGENAHQFAVALDQKTADTMLVHGIDGSDHGGIRVNEDGGAQRKLAETRREQRAPDALLVFIGVVKFAQMHNRAPRKEGTNPGPQIYSFIRLQGGFARVNRNYGAVREWT